jgi:D-tyrosyl-tRNA(Tyr) deacylase
VTIDNQVQGRIGRGLVVLLGVAATDDESDVRYLADKIAGLRIFEDAEGKMNRSLVETGGAALVISQFTLLGDCRKGRRPSFTAAAEPAQAERLYDRFVAELKCFVPEVATGRFRAYMAVELVNDGPVTLLLDSERAF